MIDIRSVSVSEFSDNNVSLAVKCDYCSADHESKDCFILVNPQIISDSEIPTRAKLTIPPHLWVVNMSDGTTNVVANVLLSRGVRFGPYQAKKVRLAIPSTTFPLKIFREDEEDKIDYYLDTTDENVCNWMCFVAPANNITEQNVICYQFENKIYYSLIRDINAGESLKVWYAPNYGAKMGKELLNNDITMEKEHSKEEISPNKNLDIVEDSSMVWNCNFCNKIEMNTAKYAKHLEQHYKDANRNSNKCSVCGKKFLSVQALRKHLKTMHDLEFSQIITEQFNSSDNSISKQLTADEDTSNDYDDTSEAMKNILEKFKAGESIKTICSLSDVRSNSENKNESDKKNNCERNVKTSICSVSDSLVGGQINEQLENTSLLVSSSSIENMNLNSLSYSDELNNGVLIDNDINKFNIFSKISDVKFNLDLAKDSDVSDNLNNDALQGISAIEQKIHNINEERSVTDFNLDFVENNVLDITNIYTKKNCNDNAMIVNTQNETENVENKTNDKKKITHIEGPPYKCDICDKKYSLIQYLLRHLKKHSAEFMCEKCLCVFGRKKTLMTHICNEARNFNCSYCNRRFFEKILLNKHLETTSRKNLCCVCQKTLKNNKSLSDHLRIFHSDRGSVCEICGKFFNEIGSLKMHQQTHLNLTFTCDICGKVFKKQYLYSKHKLTHKEPMNECTVCHKRVKTEHALSVHMLLHTDEKKYACSECNKKFIQKKDFLYHMDNYHNNNNKNITRKKSSNDFVNCPDCGKKTKKSWIQQHRSTVHSNNRFSCCYCDNVFKHPISIKRHLLAAHKAKQAEWDKAGFVWSLYSKSTATVNDDTFHAQESENLNANLNNSDIVQEPNQQICFPDVQNFTDANQFDISTKIDFINDSEIQTEISNQRSDCVELFSSVPMELDSVNVNLNNTSKGRADIQILNNLKINQEQAIFEPMLSSDSADVIDIQSLIGLPNNSNDGLITFNSGIDNFDKSPTKIDFALQMDDSLKDKDIFAPIQISDSYMNNDQENNLVLGQNAFLLEDETIVEQQEEGNILFYILNT